MEKKERNNKSKKWLIAGAVVLVLGILFFVGLHVFTSWFENKLETTVHEQSDGVYTLKLYGFQASPFVGSVSVDSMSLQPDLATWDSLKNTGGEVSRTLLELNTAGVQLSRLSFFDMMFRKKVDLGSLSVSQPTLTVTAMLQDTTSAHKPLHETASGLLKNLHIGKIKAEKANFSYLEAIKEKKEVFALENFNLAVAALTLDSASFNDKRKAYYSDNIEIAAASSRYTIPDDFYMITTDSVRIGTRDKSFSASNLHVKPTVGPTAMAKAKGRAVTYMKLDVARFKLSGLDYPEHSRTNNFFVNHILIRKPRLTAFKDKQHFTDSGTKPLPHDIARSVKGSFDIRKVDIENGYGKYEELAPRANKTGLIYFTAFNSTLRNLTNIPSKISSKNPAVVQLNTRLMGKTPLQATVRLPLLEKSGYHTLRGRIGSGGPQMLNPILVPTNFIKVDKGYVQRINFDVTLNRQHATGTMRAIYRDLEIELLSTGAKSGSDQGLGKKILSKVADWFLIENNNPNKAGEKPRIAQIQVSRDQQRSFITYWKDCIAMGLMSSMGLEKMAKQKF